MSGRRHAVTMRTALVALALWAAAAASHAISPYVRGERLPAGDLAAQMTQVERKLQEQGFTVVGRHRPPGLAQYASIVVTDPDIVQAVGRAGGPAVLGAGLRVGLKADGSVSYVNPAYWYRAYLRGGYAAAEPAVRAAQERLAKALGAGEPFGGDVPEADLPNYRYMVGMERIDASRNELRAFTSFDEALRTVQGNLARGAGTTAKVYEVVMPERQLAVFGVAMNDAETGEGWWVNKIGADHVAALPYEIYIVGNKVYSPYARYRIALAWPALGMGQFMGIVRAPEAIRDTMLKVAGETGQ